MRLILCLFCLMMALPVAAADRVPETSAQIKLSFAPIVKQVAPAVVNIYTTKVVRTQNPFLNDPFLAPFFQGRGMPRNRVENALGSGVIVQKDGLVVTNAHVVQGADEIVAILADGREIPATVQVVDPDADIALLQLDIKKVKGSLPTARLVPSDGLQVGDLVIAIGNPFGVGQTVTSGIVSAVARAAQDINDFNFFIQTDAAINPGNSGGPLVDMKGQVVGINTAIYSRDGGSLGIGFAVPAELVQSIIDAKRSGHVNRDTGNISRAWMGIGVQPVTQDIAAAMDFPDMRGALVNAVHPASPARKAGVKVGDVILTLDGKSVRDPAELRYRLAILPIGNQVTLGIVRNGKPLEINIAAIAPPEYPARDPLQPSSATPLAGATLCNVNPAVEVTFRLPADQASRVAVCAVDGRQMAARFVRPGDIIRTVNGTEIESTAQMRKLLRSLDRVPAWKIMLERDGRSQTVLIR